MASQENRQDSNPNATDQDIEQAADGPSKPASFPSHIRSFGTRRGHLTPNQREALLTLAPKYAIEFDAKILSWPAIFGNDNPVVLEVGCGMGETTVRMAAQKPDMNILGIEVYPAGVGALLARIEEQGVSNVRVIQHDAVEVLMHMIAPKALAGVHVFFPDPWHKKRHHKRRLIQGSFIELLSSRMAAGAYLHCATDWMPYAEHMLDVLSRADTLSNKSHEGYHPRPDWRPVTKFEKRGLALGHEVRDLIFTRRDD